MRKDLTMNMPETREWSVAILLSERRSPPSRISILIRRTICPGRGLVSVGVNAVGRGGSAIHLYEGEGKQVLESDSDTPKKAADNRLLRNAKHTTTTA